ncbi:MAG: tetratricopeptide repeat protein [Pseudomonadota bacterium]
MAHAELGNHLDAFDDHNQAIARDPFNPRAWNNRATSHARFREFDRAFRDYDKALELDPTYVNALINRASLAFETGRADEARQNYTSAIELEERAGRDTAGLQFLLADAACALGDVAAAVAGRQPAFAAGLFTRARMAETLEATGYLAAGDVKDRQRFDVALTRWTEAGCVWD